MIKTKALILDDSEVKKLLDKKLNNRQIQALETKEKIYEVTKLLVDTVGIESVNIRGIAKAANISIGTFYLYYSSKDEVIYSMLLYIKEKFLIETKLNLRGTTYSEKIFDLIIRDMEFISSYTKSFKKTLIRVLQGRTSEYLFADYLFSDANRTYQLLRELVMAAKDSGEFTEEVSTDDICIMIQTMQWGLVDLDNMDPCFDMVGHARRIGHAMLNALKNK